MGMPLTGTTASPAPATDPFQVTQATLRSQLATATDFAGKNRAFHAVFDNETDKGHRLALFCEMYQSMTPTERADLKRFFEGRAHVGGTRQAAAGAVRVQRPRARRSTTRITARPGTTTTSTRSGSGAPGRRTPVHRSPVRRTPVLRTPVQRTPVQQSPVQQAPQLPALPPLQGDYANLIAGPLYDLAGIPRH